MTHVLNKMKFKQLHTGSARPGAVLAGRPLALRLQLQEAGRPSSTTP